MKVTMAPFGWISLCILLLLDKLTDIPGAKGCLGIECVGMIASLGRAALDQVNPASQITVFAPPRPFVFLEQQLLAHHEL